MPIRKRERQNPWTKPTGKRAKAGTVRAAQTICTDVAAVRATQTCKLFELPAEIRLQIYCYTLVQPSQISIGNSLAGLARKSFEGKLYPQAQQPALTRVCHQIRKESLPVFYEGNVWRLVFKRSRWIGTPKVRGTSIDSWLDIMHTYCPASQGLVRHVRFAGLISRRNDRTIIDIDLKSLEVVHAQCYAREPPRQHLAVDSELVSDLEKALARLQAKSSVPGRRRDAVAAISEIFQEHVDKEPLSRRPLGVPKRMTPNGPKCAYIYSDDEDFNW